MLGVFSLKVDPLYLELVNQSKNNIVVLPSWCSAVGIRVLLNELHVILECPGSGHARRATGIYAFLEALLPVMTEHAIMKEFRGGTGQPLSFKQVRSGVACDRLLQGTYRDYDHAFPPGCTPPRSRWLGWFRIFLTGTGRIVL